MPPPELQVLATNCDDPDAAVRRYMQRELDAMDAAMPEVSPDEYWNQLPHWMRPFAQVLYRPAHVAHGACRVLRWRSATNPGYTPMPDPVWVNTTPESYIYFKSALMVPHAERDKLGAAVENMRSGKLQWGLRRDQYKGATFAIVGAGPSCRDLTELEAERRGVIRISINSAIEAHPTSRFWFVMDGPISARPAVDECQRRQLSLIGWRGWRSLVSSPRTEGIWTACTNPMLVQSMPGHCWLPGHHGPARWWRHIQDTDAPKLPTFVEGVIGATTAMQVAWYLGAETVELWGMEGGSFGSFADAQSHYYANGLSAPSPHTWEDAQEISAQDTVSGVPMLVKPSMVQAASYVNACSCWLWDAGVKVINRSRGLRYPFAPTLEHLDYVRAALEKASHQVTTPCPDTSPGHATDCAPTDSTGASSGRA